MNTIISRKPIPINKDTAKTCVAIQTCCSGRGVPDNPTVIKIKKAGTCDYIIEYDAVVENDTICFEWDKLIDVNVECWQASHLQDKAPETLPECTPPDCKC